MRVPFLDPIQVRWTNGFIKPDYFQFRAYIRKYRISLSQFSSSNPLPIFPIPFLRNASNILFKKNDLYYTKYIFSSFSSWSSTSNKPSFELRFPRRQWIRLFGEGKKDGWFFIQVRANRLVIRTAAITAVQGCSWKELEQIYSEISRAAVSHFARQLIPDRMIVELLRDRQHLSKSSLPCLVAKFLEEEKKKKKKKRSHGYDKLRWFMNVFRRTTEQRDDEKGKLLAAILVE